MHMNVGGSLTSFCDGGDGIVWCSVQNNGIFGIDGEGRIVAHPSSPEGTYILYRDKKGEYWVGTNGGVYSYNPYTGVAQLKVAFKNGFINAMTDDGILVNIDGNANRVSAICQGPKKVIFIVGMNKVCPDPDTAMKRARNVAAPVNAQRFGLSTPCVKTGKCMDCKSPDTICCQFLVTRFSRHPGRIHVILVNDSLGF